MGDESNAPQMPPLTPEQYKQALSHMVQQLLSQLQGLPSGLVMDALLSALMTAGDLLHIPGAVLRETVDRNIAGAYGLPPRTATAGQQDLTQSNLAALLKALGKEVPTDEKKRTIGFHGPENRA